MSLDVLMHANPEQRMLAVIQDGRLREVTIETQSHQSLVGNIYKGKVRRVVPQMQAIFVDVGLAEPGFLRIKDAGNAANKANANVASLFKEGQIIWVQCIKDQTKSIDDLSDKGIRLTTQLSLSSANLVYLPNSSHIGVSKKIRNAKQKQFYIDELKKLQSQNHLAGGFIVRSLTKNIQGSELISMANKHMACWQQVKKLMRETKKIGLVYKVPSLLDSIDQECVKVGADKLIINNGSAELLAKLSQFAIDSSLIFEAVDYDATQLLKQFKIEEQFRSALSSIVKLSIGGSIIIEKTEALISIDVNFGSAIQTDISQESFNLYAAEVIAQQIRLRNLSGIIIVDFINLNSEIAQKKLLKYFTSYLEKDPIRTEVHGITSLGLVELTRERIKPSLDVQLLTSDLFSLC